MGRSSLHELRGQLSRHHLESTASTDGRNTIAVIRTGWVSTWGLPSGKGATTDVRFRRSADGLGEIVEADIYLNFDEHELTFGRGDMVVLDVGGVITHELGHLIGGVHPCSAGDDAGAPACESDPAFEASVLFPTYLGPSQRTLGADDVALVCALYPGATCTPLCPSGMTCQRGMCVTTCSGPECMPMGCDAGACMPATCVASSDCAAPGVCGVFGMAERVCVPPGSTGAPCADGDSCADGLCLTSERASEPFCTVPCSTDDECGSGECASVAGDRVCIPRRPAPGCGCRAGGTGNGDLAPLLMLPVALLITVRRGLTARGRLGEIRRRGASGGGAPARSSVRGGLDPWVKQLGGSR